MKTEVVKINKNNIDSVSIKKLKKAGAVIKSGGLVAFPTETVYGLGANAFDPTAISRIYAVKGRPNDNPLIIHIADKADMDIIASNIPEKARKLADKFWPGPMTMILEKSDKVPTDVTGGLETVAVRFPDNEIAKKFIEYAGGFVAAPSANISGKPSSTKGSHVVSDLSGSIEMIIDGGSNKIGIESTIVDLTVEPPTILRPGFITHKDIEDVIGLTIDSESIDKDTEEGPKAPGMKYKHYAPSAELILVSGETESVVDTINELIKDDKSQEINVGIIATKETAELFDSQALIRTIGESADINTIGHHLYTILRDFDKHKDIKKIYSQTFDQDGYGNAVMNRLVKAAGGQVIEVEDVNKRRDIKTVIFISDEDTSRGPMARMILKSQEDMTGMNVLSRGLDVLFSEPVNPKIEEVMKNKGLDISDYRSTQFTEDDITQDTLFITMNMREKIAILKKYPQIIYIFTLSEYIGESEDEVITPFGESIESYYDLFDIIEKKVKQMVNVKE